jgi:hypothetical protein
VQDLKASVYGDGAQRSLAQRSLAQRDGAQRDEEPDHEMGLTEDAGQERQGSATAGLGEFVPPPESVGAQRRASRAAPQPEHPAESGGVSEACAGSDAACSVEGFNDLVDSRADEYYARVAPMYQAGRQQRLYDDPVQRDASLAKLDYLIHLLEEQRDERTGHVTEEIILYSFIGVFMIFIVDSFARAGKYVR